MQAVSGHKGYRYPGTVLVLALEVVRLCSSNESANQSAKYYSLHRTHDETGPVANRD